MAKDRALATVDFVLFWAIGLTVAVLAMLAWVDSAA